MSQNYVLPDLEEELFQKKNIFREFIKLVCRYTEAKEFLKQGYFLDSLNSVHQSLHHSARLAVLEVGERPRLNLWEQVRVIDSSVYKLYEELSTSTEPLDKRIELFLLALDFSVLSRLENGVEYLLDVLRSRKEPWTLEEIMEQSFINAHAHAMKSILDKMVKRSLLQEKIIIRNGIQEKGYSYF